MITNLLKVGLITGILAITSMAARAQWGVVNFGNYQSGPVIDGVSGMPAADFMVTVQYSGFMGPWMSLATAPGQNGFYFAGTAPCPPYFPYDIVALEIRAWSPSWYYSYEAALYSGDPSVRVGVSNVFATLGSGFFDARETGSCLLQPVAPAVGSLEVTIDPPEVVASGAKWRVDGGAWQESGATVSDLFGGWHTVSFSAVSGWIAPSDESKYISAGATNTMTGTYVATTGSLQVMILPAAAVSTGARWRVDEGPWQNSGTTLSGLSAGSHIVSFSTVTDWYAPAGQSVTISSGQTTTTTGTYASSTFLATGPMACGRYEHTATLLPSGKVLVAGGFSHAGVETSAELYDPSTGTWTSTGMLSVGRRKHTATLLPNGKVLVAGGGSGGDSSSAELYDPATGTWTSTGMLPVGRRYHTATLLANGKVLVVGGYDGNVYVSTAELYDLTTGLWTATGALGIARGHHTATLLHNGKVLVAGGGNIDSPRPTMTEIYDPATGIWTSTGVLSFGRTNHTATLLANGKVLVVGGAGNDGAYTSAELYDPSTGAWTTTGALSFGRIDHAAVLLANDKVLVAGGRYDNWLVSAELYDPTAGTWTSTGALSHARIRHTATLLPNGRVLVAGGLDGSDSLIPDAELFQSSTNSWTSASGGKWETSGNWSMGTPSLSDPTDYLTTAGTKTITLDATTVASHPGSLNLNNLILSAPAGSMNTLLLSNAGTATPLNVLSTVTIGSNAVLVVDNSSVRAREGMSIVSAVGNASITVRNGGEVTTVALAVEGANSVAFEGGLVATGGTSVDNGLPFMVGDGIHPAALHVTGGVHTFANGLQIRNNASLTGSGTIEGSVVVDAGGLIVSDNTDSIVTQQGSGQRGPLIPGSTGGLAFTGDVTNNGIIRAIGGSVLEVQGTLVNNGILDLINGSGNFTGSLINTGSVFDAASVKVSQVSISGQDFVVQLPSVSGHSYQLQATPSLASPDWQDIGASQAGTGGVLIFTESGGTSHGAGRFYRVGVTTP